MIRVTWARPLVGETRRAVPFEGIRFASLRVARTHLRDDGRRVDRVSYKLLVRIELERLGLEPVSHVSRRRARLGPSFLRAPGPPAGERGTRLGSTMFVFFEFVRKITSASTVTVPRTRAKHIHTTKLLVYENLNSLKFLKNGSDGDPPSALQSLRRVRFKSKHIHVRSDCDSDAHLQFHFQFR